jgi:hypothetical protein
MEGCSDAAYQGGLLTYLLKADVNEFGYLTGGDEAIVTKTAFHDWRSPYPPIEQDLAFTWVRGGQDSSPELFIHNLRRDFVLGPPMLDWLTGLVPNDLHMVAHGQLSSETMTVVQVTSVLDVVDLHRSVRQDPDSDIVDFPCIRPEAEPDIPLRMFRVPNRGQSLSVFVGDALRDLMDANGIRGLNYVRVDT